MCFLNPLHCLCWLVWAGNDILEGGPESVWGCFPQLLSLFWIARGWLARCSALAAPGVAPTARWLAASQNCCCVWHDSTRTLKGISPLCLCIHICFSHFLLAVSPSRFLCLSFSQPLQHHTSASLFHLWFDALCLICWGAFVFIIASYLAPSTWKF